MTKKGAPVKLRKSLAGDMSTRTVRLELDFSFGTRSLRWLMVAALLFADASELASESIVLTTYYPAPSGVYARLVTTDNTYLARDRGAVGIGTKNPTGKLSITNGDDARVKIYSNGGGIGVIDAVANTDDAVGRWLSINPTGGNVGIGTPNPASTLSVKGGIQVGTDGSPCNNSGKAGALRWNPPNMEVCNGSAWTAITGSTGGGGFACGCSYKWAMQMCERNPGLSTGCACKTANRTTGTCDCPSGFQKTLLYSQDGDGPASGYSSWACL